MANTGQEPGNQTPNTPDFNESDLDRMKIDQLRDKAEELGVPGAAGMHKGDLVRAVATAVRDTGAGGRAVGGGAEGGGVRTGPASSSSLKHAQEITSPQDEPERPGRSLVTTSHEVIRRWAEERNATPATVPGTEHGGHLGVLRFDFPGYGGQELRHVGWDEWFATFDARRLNFVYQEQRKDGAQSNFFRLENPNREDA